MTYVEIIKNTVVYFKDLKHILEKVNWTTDVCLRICVCNWSALNFTEQQRLLRRESEFLVIFLYKYK